MKNTIIILFIAAALLSCDSQTKETASSTNPEQYGYTLIKSANIDVVKEIMVNLTNYDLVKIRSHYTDSSMVHDNLIIQQIDTNLTTFAPMKKLGVKYAIEGKPLLFEVIEKPDTESGYTNYVYTHYLLSVTLNGKKYLSKLNQVFAMKDGIVLEEWDVYDTAPFIEMMKK
jgi:hypothetical protein